MNMEPRPEIGQLIKLVGLAPEMLPRLHKALSEFNQRQGKILNQQAGNPDNEGYPCETQVEILSSKFDSRYKTYTVEISMPMRWKVTDVSSYPNVSGHLYTPLSALMTIYKALDSDLFLEEDLYAVVRTTGR